MSLTEVARLNGVRLMVVTESGHDRRFHSSIRAEAPTEAEWQAYLPLLKAELGIYSSRMLEKSGLRSVVLCDGLTDDGQKEAGLADYARGRIFLQVLGHPDSRGFARRAVHYELFHMIDFQNDERFASDPAWAALNDRAFRYGKGGRQEKDPGATLPDESIPGFLNKYSRSGMEEDKAEVYSHIITSKSMIEDRIRRDKILKSKYLELMNRLTRFFPEVDPKFWEKGHEPRLDQAN